VYWLRYPILVLLLIPFVYADSAIQTDWSGGPGVLGPVTDWSSQFYSSSLVVWDTQGCLLIMTQPASKHVIDNDYDGAISVCSEDIDNDGDMDVIGAAYTADDITWWENTDSSGTSWIEHTVDGNFDDPNSVYSEDIDGDGDMDILGAAHEDDDITWWENIDGLGTIWTEHTVDGNFDGARSVYSEDIDGDGDMDILGAASAADDFAWWENDGSLADWTQHVVDGNSDGARSVYSVDIDGDGDKDFLGASSSSDDISWWENVDGSGTSWTKHTIDDDFTWAYSVYSEDIDNDGDMDVLGAAREADTIAWWENADGLGTSWIEHIVDDLFWGAWSVYSEDLDVDGDMDIVGAAYWADEITWWENTDGSGTSWTAHSVDTNFQGANSVFCADVNNDGFSDILGTGSIANQDVIAWWDVHYPYQPWSHLSSSIFDTQSYVIWGYIDWTADTPSGTSVSFQVRSSDDYTSMGEWSVTLTAPCSLYGILNDGDRFVQYNAILETSEPFSTPVLNDVTISWNIMGIEEAGESFPPDTVLLLIAPNPVIGPLMISFWLPEYTLVEISVFDLSGRRVGETHRDDYSQGFHDILLWDISPGIYFCRMISGSLVAARRFVVIK